MKRRGADGEEEQECQDSQVWRGETEGRQKDERRRRAWPPEVLSPGISVGLMSPN